MKKNYQLLIAYLLLSSIVVLGQAPQKIDFQAMARDGSGNPLLHQTIGVRISVIQGSTTVYTERHTPQTDDYGLFAIHIGTGTPLSGNFSSINWGLGNHKVKVEVDPNGGYVYLNMGTNILTSTPYAFYGEDDDANPTNELQSLSISGNDLTISDGNTVTLPTGTGGDNWGSQTVESDATLSGDGTTSNPLGVVGDLTDDQTLSLAGNDLTITGGNTVTLPTGGSTVWTQNGSDIYYNTGDVGIGTSIPGYPLHVKKSNVSWLVGIHNQSTSTDANGLVTRADGGTPFLVQNNYGDLLIVKNNGNVGIGTNNPWADLHVDDHIRVGYDPNYSSVCGEIYHEGGGTGFKINAEAGGGSWADMYLQTNGTTKMFIESSGKIGIGTVSPLRLLDVTATGDLGAIKAYSPSGIGVYGLSTSSYGVFGQSSTYYAGYFSGNVHVTGSLSKGGGSFVIDHPLDPENKLLRHNFVESPENLLIYRGKAELNGKGEALVELPDYFKSLTKEDEASIHLTPVGKPFLTGAEWNSDYSAIIIYGDDNREVFWEVLADRDDPVIHQLGRPVEEEKGGNRTLCERGKLLYPEAYGYPKSKGRDYESQQLISGNK